MKLLEYQAKEVFRNAGILTPTERMVKSVQDAVEVAATEVHYPCVVKAQVPVGGRGKAGGVKLVKNEDELKEATSAILGMDIKGCTVDKVLISQAVPIQNEYYISVCITQSF